jgi:hypothetical protein
VCQARAISVSSLFRAYARGIGPATACRYDDDSHHALLVRRLISLSDLPLGSVIEGVAMLHPDPREAEREHVRDELKVIACLSSVLVLAILLVAVCLTTSLVWPAEAYPLQW